MIANTGAAGGLKLTAHGSATLSGGEARTFSVPTSYFVIAGGGQRNKYRSAGPIRRGLKAANIAVRRRKHLDHFHRGGHGRRILGLWLTPEGVAV